MAPGHSKGPFATSCFNSWILNGVTVTGTVRINATDLGTPTWKVMIDDHDENDHDA